MQDLGKNLSYLGNKLIMLTFLATSDTPYCTQVYDRAISGYCTIQFTRGAPLRLGYDDAWHDIPSTPHFWPAYPGPRLRFHLQDSLHWHHTHIAFTGSQIMRWEEEGLWPFPPQMAPEGRDWEAWVEGLRQHILTPTPLSQRRAQNLLESLLIDLAGQTQTLPISPTPEWLRPLLATLQENFAPDYRLLAQNLGMSESTLRRRFRAEMGKPLHTYTMERRLAKARLLLIETDTPLKIIAEQLGYESEYFFSRQFKQWMGVSPRLYRQSR
jgi:AraC-like DNA-binding protein